MIGSVLFEFDHKGDNDKKGSSEFKYLGLPC